MSRVPAVVLALTTLLAGCAARATVLPAATAVEVPAVDIDALLRRGCYTCLQAAGAAIDDTGDPRRFDVALLLALRAKELGLPYDAHLSRARAVAPPDPAFGVYLDIATVAPLDALSGDRYIEPASIPAATVVQQGATPMRIGRLPDEPRLAEWRAAVEAGPGTPVLRGYLALVIGCMAGPRADVVVPAPPADVETTPIFRFRRGICDTARADDLEEIRAADSDFADVDYHLGLYALAPPIRDMDEGVRRFEAAAQAFPESLAIASALGRLRQDREEWPAALEAFDRVLARLPVHRDALLGRVISLSRLARHDEAMAAATQMIDLGAWFLGEAHYWRAWNAFRLRQFPPARADIDRAKTLMVNAAVYVLSGLVGWGEERLPFAESEFQEALKMDFGQCEAASYLGSVRAELGRPPEAIAAFEQAVRCFDLSITLRRTLIADVQAGPGSQAAKDRQAASHERAIAEATAGRDEAARQAAALGARAPR